MKNTIFMIKNIKYRVTRSLLTWNAREGLKALRPVHTAVCVESFTIHFEWGDVTFRQTALLEAKPRQKRQPIKSYASTSSSSIYQTAVCVSGAGDSCDWLLVEFQTRPPASFNARRCVDVQLSLPLITNAKLAIIWFDGKDVCLINVLPDMWN